MNTFATIYRHVQAVDLRPGMCLAAHDGRQADLIHRVDIRPNDVVLQYSPDPGDGANREQMTLRHDDDLRVHPTQAELDAVWEALLNVVTTASAAWHDIAVDDGPSVPPVSTVGGGVLVVDLDGVLFRIDPDAVVDAEIVDDE